MKVIDCLVKIALSKCDHIVLWGERDREVKDLSYPIKSLKLNDSCVATCQKNGIAAHIFT